LSWGPEFTKTVKRGGSMSHGTHCSLNHVNRAGQKGSALKGMGSKTSWGIPLQKRSPLGKKVLRIKGTGDREGTTTGSGKFTFGCLRRKKVKQNGKELRLEKEEVLEFKGGGMAVKTRQRECKKVKNRETSVGVESAKGLGEGSRPLKKGHAKFGVGG